MKQVIYNGEPTRLGAHGQVRKGQTLGLGYDEWMSIRGDPRFTPVPVKGMASEEKILPSCTNGYDLTLLPWGEPVIVNRLNKLKKSTMLKIVAAMREIGLEVNVTEHMTSREITDEVLFTADFAGWMD